MDKQPVDATPHTRDSGTSADAAIGPLGQPLVLPGVDPAVERVVALLTRAGRLGTSLDRDETIDRLLDLLVPELGDFAIVQLVEPDERTVGLETARAIPPLRELVAEYIRRFPPHARPLSPLAESVRQDALVIAETVDEGVLERIAPDPEQRDLLRRLHLRCYMAVPLHTPERLWGAIGVALTASSPGRDLGAAEQALIQEFAARTAAAVGHASLFRDAERAQQALRAGETRLRAMIDQSALATCVYDAQGRVLAVNDAMTRLFGLRLGDLPPDYSVLRDPQLEAQGLLPVIRRAFAGETVVGPAVHYDLRRTTVSGEGRTFWVQPYIYPVRAADGGIDQVVLTAVDVTVLKEAESALRSSEQRLELALEAGRMGTFDWDVVQGTVAWSPALERLHGYAPGGFAGTIEAYWNEVHPDDQGHLAELMPEILAGRRPHHLEYRIVRTDGSVRWVEGRGTVMRDAGGRPLRIVGICADITERKHAEHELQRLAAIVHSSRDAIVSKTLEGRITSWNPSAERIFGYTADEMIGSAIFRLIPEAHHDQEREWLRRIGAGEVVESYDAQRIRKDGRVVVTAVTISPIHDAGGKVVGASSIKRDVSEQREVQEALRRSEARYRSLTQATSAAVWSIGPGGPGEEGARWWCALTGQRPEQVMTADWLDALHPDDRDAARAAWQQAMATGGVFQHEYRVRAIDGTYRHISVRGVPVPAGAGAPVEWVGTFDDVTEQRETEERLRQGAKMEAVGRLAGGLAHDFNNQLHAVSGFASFVAREPGLSDRAQQDLAEIRKAAERMAGLTRQLLAFSRQQVLAPETLDLDAAIADSESMLQRLIGSDIEMHLVPARRPVWVRVDRAQLLQILLNLAINARDAMPSGGHLTLRTRERVVTGTRAALGPGYASVEPGVYAELLVTDTGAGIAPEHLPFLFEPFFTTKEVGKGTGLGLATVHGIVTQSRGYVWAESPLGGGATFTVLLPLADAPEPGAAAGGRAPSRGAQPARILVVDDEPSALALAVRTLREEGHDVWSAVNGRLALEELERLGGAVDVVVTDIVMPVMGGRELGERLAREHPGIALIWMSGYPVDTLVASPGLLERYPFLQKPVQPDLLAETVRMVLARRRGRASGEALMHAAE